METTGKYREAETAYMIMKGDPNLGDHIDLNGTEYKFKSQQGQSFFTRNKGLAMDIDRAHGKRGSKSVAVAEVRVQDNHDRGHSYFWGQWPEMPWKRHKQEENVPVQSTG